MVVYHSMLMIMRINHMLGYQGWEDLEWWTCARAKENYDYEALMMSSLSDCTWLEKEWKFRLSTTWSLHFIFLFFYLIHPSHIFIATPLLSFSSLFSFSHCHIFSSFFTFLLYIFFFFLSFFSILILFSLFLPILTTFQNSQLLSFLHAYNLKF
jgi:hypothetical protein